MASSGIPPPPHLSKNYETLLANKSSKESLEGSNEQHYKRSHETSWSDGFNNKRTRFDSGGGDTRRGNDIRFQFDSGGDFRYGGRIFIM